MNTSPEIQKTKRPRRWLKRLAWSFIWLLTLLALTVVVLNWKGARAWKATVEEVTAKGDSLDPATFIPAVVPEEDNMASAPIFARIFEPGAAEKQTDISAPSLFRVSTDPGIARRMPPKNEGWRSGQPVDLASWQTCYWANVQILKSNPKQAAQMPAVWKEHLNKDYWKGSQQSPAQDVLFALSVFETELEQVSEASEQPLTRFPIQYENGIEARMPHYMPLTKLVRVLALKASAELVLNHNDAGLEDLLLALRLADSTKAEPILISYLVRLSLIQSAYEPLWTGIVQHRWNDQQLARLEAHLRSIHLVKNLDMACRGDRNLSLASFAANQRNPEFFKIWLSMSGEPNPPMWMIPLVSVIPQGWFDYNKVSMLRDVETSLSCSDPERMRIFPERVSALNLEITDPSKTGSLLHFMLPGLSYKIIRQINLKGAFGQSAIGLARIAIALERHFLKHGIYPENLASLDETFSLKGGIPHDVATGNPPHYSRISADRFTLYYDGWNGKDDGGVTHMNNGRIYDDYDQGDWVWPMPRE